MAKKLIVFIMCLCMVFSSVNVSAATSSCKKGGSHKWKVTGYSSTFEYIMCTKCKQNETRSHKSYYKKNGASTHTRKCRNCKFSVTSAHSFKCTKTKASTCKTNGYKIYKCTNCGYQKKTTIPKVNHTPKLVWIDGKKVYKCKVCGKYPLAVA